MNTRPNRSLTLGRALALRAILAGSIAALLGDHSAQAATFTWTNADTSGVWSSTSTTTDWNSSTIPNAAGALVTYSYSPTAGAAGTVTLNTPVTIGQVQISGTGNAGIFTIAKSGSIALTFDNTGGLVNPLNGANSNAAIAGTANINTNDQLVVNPDIVISNTDLDVGGASGVRLGASVNNSGITATTSQNLNFRVLGNRNINVNDSIGLSGAGTITINNLGTGTNPTSLNGDLGAKVGSINQSSTTSALVLAGTNTFYGGATTVAAGATLRLGSATALGGNGTTTGTGGAVSFAAGSFLDASATTVLTTTNTISLAGSLTFVGTSALTLSAGQGLSGASGSLIKLGTGGLTLTGNNTYAASTTIGTAGLVASGGTLTLSGAAGSIATSSGYTIYGSGSQLNLDYSGGAGPATLDRLNNSGAVTLNLGGELRFTNGTNAANTSETFGMLNLGTGVGIVTINQGGTGGAINAITSSGFSRGSSFATALIRSANLGLQNNTNRGELKLTSTAGLTQVGTGTSTTGLAGTTKNLIIVPYLLGDTSGASTAVGKNFVTYDTVSGFRVLDQAEASLVTAGAAGDNVKSVAGANNVTGAQVFNSLLAGAGTASNTPATTATTVTGNNNTLTLTSGALANVATGASGTSMVTGFSSIIFGTTGANEAIITNANTNAAGILTIDSPINTSAAGGGLTKAGGGLVVISASNLYTGVTTVNQGTLQIGNNTTTGDLSTSSSVSLNGGSLTFNRSNTFSYTNAITGTGSAGSNTVTQAGGGALTLGNVTNVQSLTRSGSTGALTLGTITGIGTLTDSSTSGSTAPTTLNQSGSGLTIGTITGAPGSVVTLTGDGTDSTTISTVSGTGTLVVNGASGSNVAISSGNVAGLTFDIKGGTTTFTPNSGATTSSNFLIEGGTFIVANTARFQLAQANQTFSMTGGTANLTATTTFGFRVGGANGANGTGASNIAATQSGGSLTANLFNLGATDTGASTSPTYALSGGTFTDTGAFVIGADTAGAGSATFTLSGTGKLSVATTISGNLGAGAKQAFVFSGGTLAVGTFTATNLTSTAGTAVVLNTTNTLTNAGGTLAPGDIGTAGKTAITGHYSVSSPTTSNAAYAVDLGTTTQATAFQTGGYDFTTVSLTTALGGRLNVNLIGAFVATPPTNANTFTVLTSTGVVSGNFNNYQVAKSAAANVIAAGTGSFSVAVPSSAAGSVVLSAYVGNNTYTGSNTAWDAASANSWSVYDPGSSNAGLTGSAITASGAIALFSDGTASTGAIGVSLNSTRNIQGIQFSSTSGSRAYSINQGGSGALVLDNTGNGAAATISDSSTLGTTNTISVPITLNSDLGVTVTNATNTLGVNGAIGGTGTALTKSGAGKLTLSSTNNNYTGPTNVNGGTLEISGSISASTAVNVTGGTLLLSGTTGNTNPRLGSAANVTLNGSSSTRASIDLSGITSAAIDQSVGTLSLSGNSSLDFGALDQNYFRFADSSGKNWSGFTLSVYHWESATTDHLFFGDGSGLGLTTTQLGLITFYGGTPSMPGTPLGTAAFLSGGELTLAAVPEPSSLALVVGVLGLVGYRERRRLLGRRGE